MHNSQQTPWGEIQDSKQYEPHIPIWYITTPGHGGYKVDPQWAAENMSKHAVDESHHEQGSLWYEEDAAWAILEWEVAPIRDASRRERTKPLEAQAYDDYVLDRLTESFPGYLSRVTSLVVTRMRYVVYLNDKGEHTYSIQYVETNGMDVLETGTSTHKTQETTVTAAITHLRTRMKHDPAITKQNGLRA